MDHNGMFRQCLMDLDVPLMRRLWRHVSPHLPQPRTDDECLQTMHMARVQMTTLPVEKVAYSEKWLKERQTGTIAYGVGIGVIAPPRRRERAKDIEHEMSHAVELAIRSGVDLATEPDEIRRRMLAARDRV